MGAHPVDLELADQAAPHLARRPRQHEQGCVPRFGHESTDQSRGPRHGALVARRLDGGLSSPGIVWISVSR